MTGAEGTLPVRGAAPGRQAARTRLSAGWQVVAAKELADHLHSLRFGILFVVLGLAAVVPLYFVSDAIRSTPEQFSGAREIFLALFVASYSPTTGVAIPSVAGFVGIVAPLLGVAFAFDAINAERSDGTLPRLLSQPIHRDDVITGKFVAGLMMIMLALVSVVVVIAGFGIFRLGIVPSGQAILRVIAWLGYTIVWVSLWLAFGLLLSVVIRRAATAALAGFGIWVLLQVFGKLLVGLVAGVVAPVATGTSLEQQIALQNLSDAITRIVPLTIYQEGSRVLLNPQVTSVSTPATLEQVTQQAFQQQIPQLLGLDQSVLLVWPHIVALMAVTMACFALAFVRFMRQEVRA